MSKCIAYTRVSTEQQDFSSQKNLIERHASSKDLIINQWIALEISSQKDEETRRIVELRKLESGDILITSELSRLGRSMVGVVQLVNDLVSRGVRVIIIHQGIDAQNGKLEGHQKLILGIFSSLAEMERDLISLRTIEGLKVAKANGRLGGRRKGVLQRSKYDKHLPRIKELLKKGLPLESILKIINEGKSKSLSNYLEKRGIRAKTKSFSEKASQHHG